MSEGPLWNVPLIQNPFFRGREEQLTTLRERLAVNVPIAVTQVVSGLGGIGKTQLVNEYAWRCRKGQEGYPRYNAIFWINAATEDALNTSYDHIADLLGRKSEIITESVQNVRAYLENEKNQGYLLLYDNADTPSLLDAYLPSPPHGHILVTSRADEGHILVGEQAFEVLPLDNIPEDEAVTFLLNRAITAPDRKTKDGTQAARELARALFGFPLALEQAAAYITVNAKSFRSYLLLYREAEQKGQEQEPLNREKPRTGKYRDEQNNEKTVRTTWKLNFEAVQQHCPEATQLMELAAFLALYPIPIELIAQGAEEIGDPLSARFPPGQSEVEKEDAWDTLLTALTRYSLVTRNTDRTFSLHGMVGSVLRADLTTEQRETLSIQAERAVMRAFPADSDFVTWSVSERILPHARPVAERIVKLHSGSAETVRLLNQVGLYLYNRGQYVDSGRYLETALTINRDLLSEGHPDIAASLINLAALYLAQGRYEQAELLLQEALEIQRVTRGEDHPHYAAVLNSLALLYKNQGRYKQAEPLYIKSLEIKRAAHGEQHPEFAIGLNNLAALNDAQGHYEQAEALFKEGLEIQRAVLPEGHPDIAQSLNNLAALYFAQGKYAESEPLYKEALKLRRVAFSQEHPLTAQSLNNLALLFQRQGRYDDAKSLYEEALKIRRAILPQEHPDIAISLWCIATLYQAQRRYDEAEQLYIDAFEILQKALGESHPETQKLGRAINSFLSQRIEAT